MAITGGSIVWILDAETGEFTKALISAEQQAKATGDTIDKINKKNSMSFKDFSSEASNAFSGIASGIGNVLKVMTAATIGGAFGLKSLIDQASDLQSITASFQSLTGSAELTQDVLKQLYDFSFKTAFSTSDINAAARSFLSAGVSVKDLGGILSDVGDLAGATGANLGQLTLPLQQALAKGKLQTQDFNQIMDAGAGAIGKALKEKVAVQGFGSIQEAMEAGAVSSELLFQTIHEAAQEGGFAFQGALRQSLTFAGQLSNLQETIGNVGLAILGVDKATGAIDPSGIFARLSRAVQDATKWLNDNIETIKYVGGIILDNFIPVMGALATAYLAAQVAAIAFDIAANANPIALIIDAIVILIGVLAFLQIKFNWIGKTIEWLSTTFKPFWELLSQIGKFIGGVFVEAWNNITKAFNEIITALKPFSKELQLVGKILLVALVTPMLISIATITAIATAIGWVAGFIAKNWKVLGPIIMIPFLPLIGLIAIIAAIGTAVIWLVNNAKNIAVAVGNFFTGVINGITNFFTSVWNNITSFFTTIYNSIVSIMTAIWNFVSPILNFIKNLYIIVWGSILLFIINVMQGIWNAITTIWNAIVGFFSPILNAIFTTISSVLTNIWNTIVSVFNSVLAFIQGVWNSIYNTITGIVNNIINFFAPAFNWLIGAGQNIVNGLINGISSTASGVWNAIKGVADQIGKFFSGAGNWLFGVGQSIIQGLINGIAGMAGQVAATVENIATDIVGNIKEKLNIHSPSRVMVEMGGFITQGLIDGINSGINDIQNVSSNMAMAVQDPMIEGFVTNPNGIGALSNNTNNSSEISYNIGEINIASEADGESWLRKLTNNQEITSKGLVPQQRYV